MQDKRKRIHVKKTRYAGLLLVVPLLLCGCTKKEELLLLSEETVFAEEETGWPEEETGWPEEVPAAQERPDQDAESSTPTEKNQNGAPAVSEEPNSMENPGVIYVHVCGAVVRPGVYELRAGSRVYEAVHAAGGFAEGADQNYVNQAQELGDGIKLVIPTMEEAVEAREREVLSGTVQESAQTADAESTAARIGIIGNTSLTESGNGGQAGDSDGRININTASEAQLCDIPGIGATRAAAIIAYRESHGGFQKPEDIMKVSGIKKGMYEKIKDSISVN